jgi:AraC-like DNA-binding protein
MKMDISTMLLGDVFWDKYDASPKNPFDINIGSFPEDTEDRLDIHYALEIGIMLKGQARRSYPDYSFDIGPGQVWLCGLWEPHTRRTIKHPCERVIISVLPQTLSGISFWPLAEINLMRPFMAAPPDRPQVAAVDRDRMIALGREIEWIHDHGQPDHQNIWYLLLLMEVLLLTMKDWHPTDSCRQERSAGDFVKISQAIQMVFGSQERISEKQAAAACHLPLKIFNTLFENLMGLSFSRFALRYRIYQAARELINSDQQIKKIATQWGFTDTSHLNRCFMECYGSTAQKFRQHFHEKVTPPS